MVSARKRFALLPVLFLIAAAACASSRLSAETNLDRVLRAYVRGADLLETLDARVGRMETSADFQGQLDRLAQDDAEERETITQAIAITQTVNGFFPDYNRLRGKVLELKDAINIHKTAMEKVYREEGGTGIVTPEPYVLELVQAYLLMKWLDGHDVFARPCPTADDDVLVLPEGALESQP